MPEMNIKAPKISMPDVDFNLKGPKLKGDMDVDVSVPKISGDVTGPSVDVKGPNLDIGVPDVELECPEAKLKGPKFKMPEMHFKAPKISMPDFDLNLKGPKVKGDVDVSVPKLEGDLKGPDVDIKGPKLDVDIPDVELEGPEGKWKGPKFKMPEMHIKAPKISMPDVDLNLKGPQMKGDLNISGPKLEGDLKGPEIDLKGPKLDIDAPDIDIHGPDGKLKFPKMRLPKFGMPGVKGEAPQVDVNLPKGELEFAGPSVNLEGPSVAVEGHLKGPSVKMPEMHFRTPQISMPEIDLNLKGHRMKGEVDVSVPKIEGDLKGPGIELKGSDIDLECPDLNIEGPEGNVKLPKFKMPKFGKFKMPKLHMSGPKIKGKKGFDIKSPKFKADASLPKVEGEIKAPGLDVTVPSGSASLPDVNVEGPDISLKQPKFKLSNICLKGPSVNLPSMDVSAPSVSAPDLDINLKGPKLKSDVDLPKAELHGPEGKVKFPKFSLPKIGKSGMKLEGPEVDLQGKVPSADINVLGPSIEGGASVPAVDVSLKGPKLEGGLGLSGDVKGPKIGLGTPDVGLGSFEGKLKMPKSPGLDVDVSAPDLNVKGSPVKMTSGAGISAPEFDVNLKGSKIKGDLGISGGMSSPSVAVEAPNVNLDGSGGGIKLPCMKLPQFGISVPQDEGVSISGPQIKGDLGISGGMSSPKVAVEAPKVNLEGSGGGIKLPSMKLPQFGISGSQGEGPSLKGDTRVAGDLKGPQIGVGLPGVNISGMGLDTRVPDVSLRGPSLNVSAPKASGPDLNIALKGTTVKGDFDISRDVKSPELRGDLKGPKLELKGPSMGVNVPQGHLEGPSGKVSFPKMKIPKFVASGQELTGREVGVDVDFPQAPEASFHGGAVNVELEEPDIKLKKSKIKMPKFAFSKPKAKGSVGSPEVSASVSGCEGELKASLGSLEGDLEVGEGSASPKGKFSFFKTKKSRHRSSSFKWHLY
uniref:AHNAK nucleoprotein n=1 Tax=Varanus komodoensis TaxID=61221 RepID=A0A8D2KR79_VARKO